VSRQNKQMATVCSWQLMQRQNRSLSGTCFGSGRGKAKADDVVAMQTVLVDLDHGDVQAIRDHLAQHLGPPSLEVVSGERLTRADRSHAASTDIWDADLWSLNTLGGVVDLRTGILGPTCFDSSLLRK